MAMQKNKRTFYEENGYLIVRGAGQDKELQNLADELDSL